MKKVYFDFETNDNMPLSCDLLQATFMFYEDDKLIEVYDKKIKLEKNFEDLSLPKKEGLKFNKILNQEDLNKHNLEAIKESEYWQELEKIIKKNKFEFSEIIGWNNSNFDNIILKKKWFLNQLYFKLGSYDLMERFKILKKDYNLKSLKLSEVHKVFIGGIENKDFHNSFFDVKAVRDLDLFFDNQIQWSLKK